MPQKFKVGDPVRQIMPAPVKGVVVDYALDKTTGDVSVHVAGVITDEAGEHLESRYFTLDQIEIDPDAPPRKEPEVAEEEKE